MGIAVAETGAQVVDGTVRRIIAAVADDPRARRIAGAVAALLFGYLGLQLLCDFADPGPTSRVPAGVLLQGVVIGGLTALIAFGIALVYRSNRIINFAQGDLGGLPASLAVLLILDTGVPYFLALPVGLATAIALGGFVEFVFIRRFFRAPRLILTVVTIGVSQILAGAATALPRAFGLTTPPQNFPSPFNWTFSVGSTVFRGNEVVAMLAVPVVIGGLAAFFRYTHIGIAVRASAESADRAALLGVPVKRIQTVVWIIATSLAFIAIFLRAGIVGLPIGSVLGPTILIRALAAAVIGRMEKLPVIFAASLALGALESAVVFSTGRAFLVDPILFVVVIVALLVQRRGQAARVADDQTSTWQAAREVRPVPRELKHLPEIRWGSLGLRAAFALALIGLPAVLSEGQTYLAAVVVVTAMVGVSLVVLTGWAGQVSLGQFAFVGVGAIVGGWLTSVAGWDLAFALPAAGLAGSTAAMVIGLPALRIQGLYLAVVTLAFALATSSYLLRPEYIHWLPTDRIERTPLLGQIAINTEVRYYYLTIAVFGLAIGAVRGLRASRSGRVLVGVRENPRAAQAFGVNATAAKLTAFAISGFIAAVAGALLVHQQQSLVPNAYDVDQSRQAFITVVIGGLGSVPGAVLGAVFVQGVEYFRTVFPEVVRPYLQFLTSGVGLIVVLLLVPGGFSQLFYAGRDRLLRLVAERRGILVPSLVADARDITVAKGRAPTIDLTDDALENGVVVAGR